MAELPGDVVVAEAELAHRQERQANHVVFALFGFLPVVAGLGDRCGDRVDGGQEMTWDVFAGSP
ncbi:hypothetical protein Isolate57596_51070 (plasmid) [Mycobacteroides abscessus subsp. abscessus]